MGHGMPLAGIHAHWLTSSGGEGHIGAPDALFPYWSFTKTAIAVCTLKLCETGVFDLHAKIQGQPFTLHQLLAHTSGLPDYGHVPEYSAAVLAKDPPWSREKMLGIALSKGMLFAPEQGWSYSNIGYMFLKEAIEAATGRPLGDVIDHMITGPLKLDSVEMALTPAQFAQVHWPACRGYDPLWVYHGCLIGTASDAVRLLHGVFTGGMLQPETLALMTRTKILGGPLPQRPWTECGYGLGLMAGRIKGGQRSMGHSGAGPACVNAVYHFPDANDPMTIACFTDGGDEGVPETFAVDRVLGIQHSG
ncbi:MAG: serine hydrolase domain-containing protein [Sulfitobacter sp.]